MAAAARFFGFARVSSGSRTRMKERTTEGNAAIADATAHN